MRFETQAIHVGQEPDPTTGAVVVPIYQTSTYAQAGPGEHKGYEYSRTQNPTRTAYESCLAALDGGAQALAFASGCAAASTVMNCFRSGDHVVVSDDVYGGTFRLFDKVLRQYGLDFTFVDTSDLDAVGRAIRPNTRLLWIETPTNPLLKITDLPKATALAREKGTRIVVDNTFLSPYFQKPLALGADLVVYSATKYLGGHSDLVGGAIVCSASAVESGLFERLKFCQNAVGAIPGPFDCWLALRGLKTLAVRMRQHEKNALEIARFLESHPRVDKVVYPGLPSHPQHALAREQMTGFGGIISFRVKGGLEAARAMLRSTKLFFLAESLGGVESLIEHPAIMTHASIPKEIRERIGITDSLIRISVGIEAVEDLIEDLRAAFEAIGKR
ncbi:MAG: cystathionine gamma-synthase [Planctomycetes bacterium]|nr:cystathionine gamma-synthase [Planctomycetota bacterium]MBI3844619.1 cystathionine gamma-synthase [Planctomycetota bacterium]